MKSRWRIAVLLMLVASGCGGSSHLAKTDKDLARITAAKADPAFSLVPPGASVDFGPAVTYGGDKVEHDASFRDQRVHVDEHLIEQTVAYEKRSRVTLRQVAAFYVENLPQKGWVLESLGCRPGSGAVQLRASKTIKGIHARLAVGAYDLGWARMSVEVPIVGARRQPASRGGSPPTNACLDFISLERPWSMFEATLREAGDGLEIANFKGHVCAALEDRARRSALTEPERAFFANTTYAGLSHDTYDYDRGIAELIISVRASARGSATHWRVSLVVEKMVWELCTIEGPLDHT